VYLQGFMKNIYIYILVWYINNININREFQKEKTFINWVSVVLDIFQLNPFFHPAN